MTLVVVVIVGALVVVVVEVDVAVDAGDVVEVVEVVVLGAGTMSSKTAVSMIVDVVVAATGAVPVVGLASR